MSDNSRDANGPGADRKSGDSSGPDARGKGKKNPWIGRSILAAVALVILIPLGTFLAAYIMVDVPEPEELPAPQVSEIYAADSETQLARVVPPEGNRSQVPVDQIPDTVKNAVLAAEDREFYTNPGFSLTGFGRAALGQLTGDESAGGGSTITQQYVKNALVGNEHSYIRKARELVYSVKMTNQWSKDEILGAYLNTVYFGRNAYGVEAAAQAYFDKPLADLGAGEAAVLAASIQLPSQLDPWTNPEGAEQRWNYVLDGMVEIGTLSQEERDSLTYPETVDPATNQAYTEATGPNGMIKNQVMAELESVGISEQDVNTRGLEITTTIDSATQQSTVDAVQGNLEGERDNLRSAAVSIEPGTGAVRGYYGGEDAIGWDFADAPLQTGSTFKIFGLAAALQQGIPLSTGYSSAPVTIPGGITITNVDGYQCGYCSIREALKFSHNTSFIRLQQDLVNGTEDTADMAHALGMARELPGIPETLTEDGDKPYEGIILGQYQSRPIDMSIALATLANGGVWHQPHFVERVETGSGEVLYEHEQGEGERRVSENVANNLLSAMQPIAGYSGGSLADGRVSAAKTGTTQLGDTGYNKDAWMIGATPQLATSVWVGTEDNSPLLNTWGGNMYGSGVATDIWKDTLDGALAGEPVEQFPAPQPIAHGPATSGAGSAYVPPATTQNNAPPATRETAAPMTTSAPPETRQPTSAPAPPAEGGTDGNEGPAAPTPPAVEPAPSPGQGENQAPAPTPEPGPGTMPGPGPGPGQEPPAQQNPPVPGLEEGIRELEGMLP